MLDARTYAQALEAIEARGRYGIRLGLGRVRALLRAMGDPELAVRGALVAGTNGKGSVIALAGCALRAAGYRVGETPKPHLVTYRERIVVDGRPIAAADFARLVDEALPAADRIARRLGPPTEFELLTAVMFRHFAEVDLDVALVEVGLGGRLDATNAWDGGVAVLTNVGLDHTDRLGPTIAHIAREKAAIVKRGDVAVTGADGEALAIVRRRCARLGVPLAVAPPAPILGWSRDAITLELPRLGAADVGLRGRHQASNAAVADGLLDALELAGIASVPPEARRRGYAAARWPGRLELVTARVPGSGEAREVLLDGAHNPDGARALAQALDDLRPHLAGGGDAPGSAGRGLGVHGRQGRGGGRGGRGGLAVPRRRHDRVHRPGVAARNARGGPGRDLAGRTARGRRPHGPDPGRGAGSRVRGGARTGRRGRLAVPRRGGPGPARGRPGAA